MNIDELDFERSTSVFFIQSLNDSRNPALSATSVWVNVPGEIYPGNDRALASAALAYLRNRHASVQFRVVKLIVEVVTP